MPSPTIDMTSAYISQATPGIVGAINQLFDPRSRMMVEEERRKRELFPLQRERLQGQTALDAARAVTEGSHAGLYRAQTADQDAITGARRQLIGFGGAPVEPQLPQSGPGAVDANGFHIPDPAILEAANSFNENLPLIPGAPAPQPAPAGAQPPMAQYQTPLLPPPPQSLAALIGAISKNPNAQQVMTAMAQEEALRGGYSEARSREIALGQGKLPNINTAVTPQWQGNLINTKNAMADHLNNADNLAAMQRVQEQQQGAGQRTVLGAMLKASTGNGTVKAPAYGDRRKMNEDAAMIADRQFDIGRDEAGNPTSQFNPIGGLPATVVQQRDQFAKRVEGYIAIGKTMQEATDRANFDLFGSMNTSDPQFFNQGAAPWLGLNRPFSAINVNTNAMGDVERAGNPTLNGQMSPGLMSIMQKVGLQTPQQEAPTQAPAPVMEGPQKPRDTRFDIRPSKEQDAMTQKNNARAEDLRQQVKNIESILTDNLVPQDRGIVDILLGHTNKDLNQDPDARNELVRKRTELLAEIEKLNPAKSGGNGENGSDIVRRNLTSP